MRCKVRNAGEAPEPAIKAEGEEDAGLQWKNPGKRPGHVGELGLVQVEIEAQPIQPGPRDCGGDDIVGKGQQSPPVSAYSHRRPLPILVRH